METVVEQARRRAAEVRATHSPEFLAEVEAVVASMSDRLGRMFVGPANKKGRCPAFFATQEELDEFKAR